MIPWLFAYDHVNYARYLSIYWCEMMSLPSTHPDAHHQMDGGKFAVQRSATSAFSQVAIDQCIEQSLNRDTKTSGGIIGISQRAGAVQRWIVTAHLRADFTRQCKRLAGMFSDATVHKQARAASMKHDEEDVKKVMGYLQTLQVNPFDTSASLVSLSSGINAPDDVEKDLLQAHSRGYKAMSTFFLRRLLGNAENFMTQ